MTLATSKSKNSTSYYVIRSVRDGKKKFSKVVERLGNHDELVKRFGTQDTVEKAREYVAELTRIEKEGRRECIVKYAPNKLIPIDERQSFSAGYLFLQKIYHELGIDKICHKITNRHKFDFDLNSILSRLVYGRILFPASKLQTFELSNRFLEPPNFEIHHIYRGLKALAKESDFIQSELYKNSTNVINRKKGKRCSKTIDR